MDYLNEEIDPDQCILLPVFPPHLSPGAVDFISIHCSVQES